MTAKVSFVTSDAVMKVMEKYQILPTDCVEDYLLRTNRSAKRHIKSREQLTSALRHLIRKNKLARVSNGVYCTVPYFKLHVKSSKK